MAAEYVHFSSRPELPEVPPRAINRFAGGTGPLGVYAYPRTARSMTFAADRPYAFVLTATVPMVNTLTYSADRLERDLSTLSGLADLARPLRLYGRWLAGTGQAGPPFHKLWYVISRITRPGAEPSVGVEGQGFEDPSLGRELLLALGIQAIEDHIGILYSSEPEQAVFLTNTSFKATPMTKRNGPRALAYDDFYRTGVQDCGNAMSIDEFDLRSGDTAKQIVDRTWAEWEEDGMEEQWLEQQDDLEGLDPHQCYKSWRTGWKECAVMTLEEHVERAKERRLDDEEYERETRGNPPKKWWHRPSPAPRPCYRTKADALKAFLDANSDIVENYGGADYAQSPSEFDSINHKYGLKGKRAARSIADAVWYAMPVGKPFCLDRIDLDALNDTSPARESATAFRLPDASYEAQAQAQEAAYYSGQGQEEEMPSWVTEHEHAERVFPALPSMEGLVPFGARLERREPWAETYQLYEERPLGPAPVRDVTPVRLTLEEREPGVETYSINPAGKVKIKMTSTRSGKVGWIRRDGTPSDHESEAGFFTPGEAQATIDEYTDNLVRVVGRCANRFEMLPTSNPPPGEHPRRRKFKKPRTGVHVDASSPTMLRELTRIAIPYTARREGDGSFTVFDEARWKAIMSSCEAHEVEPPKQNPAWVTKILSKHFVKLEEEVPPRFLPKITKAAFSRGGRISATMKEYGCGAYGCVLPTLDPSVVLKLTTDDTEAEFANDLAGKLTKPVVVKYHMTRELPDKYKGRPSFLLWRDAADHVGEVEQTIAEESGADPTIIEEAIGNQHLAAQAAFEALDAGEPAVELLQKWEDAAREMGLMVPELRELAEGMITNLQKDKVFMGDVHGGNIGRVNGHWVVVDPGHIAVLTA